MYKIGDKVVYPMHGAGVIEAIEEVRILQERKSYYIMRMPIGGMKVMIPVNNTIEIGIRDIIDREAAMLVVKVFAEFSADFSTNWNRRYRENMLKIKNGDACEVAYVVKTLMLRDKLKGLSTGERKMLNTARQILVSELVMAELATHDELNTQIDEIVQQAIDELSNISSP